MSIVPTTRPVLTRPVDGRLRPSRPSSLATTIDPVRVLRRHVLAIIVSIFAGGLLGTAAYFACVKVYPLYTGQVMFEVMPGLQQSTDVSTVDLSNDEMVFRIAQTETYMLTNRQILAAALKHPDIRKTEWHKKFIETNADGTETFNDDEALDELVKDVGTSVVRASNLFNVHWSAHVASDVPKVLNCIERAYTDNRSRRDTDIYNRNKQTFEVQLSATRRDLENLALTMKRHLRDNGITTPKNQQWSPEHTKLQILNTQRAQSTAQLNLAKTAYSIASAKLEGLMEPTADDIVEAERDLTMMDVQGRVSMMRTEHNRLSRERGPDDPMVVRAANALGAAEETRDAKRTEIVRRNLEGRAKAYSEDIERFRNVVEKLEEEIEQIETILKDEAGAISEFEAMEIQREHLQDTQKQQQQLIAEVDLMRVRADASRVRTAVPALEPRLLSFPKPEVVIPLGVLVALGLTIGAIFLRELMDQRVKSTSDLAVLPGAFVLGGIPELEEDPTNTSAAELVVRKQPFSVLAESYRQVFTAMSQGIERSGHQTLLLVGGLPGAGTTTAATNLAAAAAATGKKVLVIDANFRRPRLAQAMEVPGDGPGLGDLLSGAATLEESIVDAGNGISVIPAGTPANRVIERLTNGLFDGLVAELRGKYDLIIFDAPPAVVAGDAMVLANKVDAAMLVVRAHQEHRGLVARMINQLADARCELLGVLLNRPRGTAGGYFKKNYATMAQYATPQA